MLDSVACWVFHFFHKRKNYYSQVSLTVSLLGGVFASKKLIQTGRRLLNTYLIQQCIQFINIRAQSYAIGFAKKLVSFISSEHLCLATTTQRSIKPSTKRIMSSENFVIACSNAQL